MTQAITILETSIIRRSDQALASVVDGQVVMMMLATGSYYYLDEIGSHIWELCAEPMTVGALSEALSQRYEAERPQVVEELCEFLQDMVREQLIEVQS